MKRTLLTLVAVALFAAVIVLRCRSGGDGGDATPVSGDVAEAEAAEHEPPPPVLEVPAVEEEPAREVVESVSVDVPATEASAEAPAAGIPVLVVTPDGVPVAGVPVALVGRIDAMEGSEKDYAEATTDARGRAFLVEEEGEREQRERMKQALGVEFLFRVEAQVLFSERPSHDLGGDLDVTDPIRLVLPAAGAIRVHVSTPDGEPLPEWIQVFPFWRLVGSDEGYDRIGAPRETVVDGVATFPVLPLGHEYQFNVGGGKKYRSGQAFAAGPTRAGEVVEVDAVLGPPLATITGILVGEDGEPLTGVEVSMALFMLDRDAPADAEPDRVPWLWAPLDFQGRFTRVTHLEPDDTQRVALMIHEESRHTPSEVDRFARWDEVVALPPGEVHDLGTLVLRAHQERRFLVAGRVFAEDGARLRNIRADVSYWNSETGRWTQLSEDRVKVGSDGEFETYTILEEVPERFTVSAGARGCLGTSIEASLGDQGLELILRRGGGLAGRFVTDDPAALPLLAVLIQGEDFEREPDIGLGAFHVNELPPGKYSVIAKGHGTDWRYGGIEDVVVPQGGFADDPRLERIDLGGACRVMRLTVLDPDGKPIPKRYIDVNDRANDGGNFRTNEDGEMVALVPATAEELGLSVSYEGKRLGVLWSASSGYTGTITLLER